jgi:hypothetical protein
MRLNLPNTADDLQKDQCSREFKELMDCIRAQAAKLATKL